MAALCPPADFDYLSKLLFALGLSTQLMCFCYELVRVRQWRRRLGRRGLPVAVDARGGAPGVGVRGNGGLGRAAEGRAD